VLLRFLLSLPATARRGEAFNDPGSVGFSTNSRMSRLTATRIRPSLKPEVQQRFGRQGDVRLRLDMLLMIAPDIHPVELIAGEDDEKVVAVVKKWDQVLAHRVGRSWQHASASSVCWRKAGYRQNLRRTGRICRLRICRWRRRYGNWAKTKMRLRSN